MCWSPSEQNTKTFFCPDVHTDFLLTQASYKNNQTSSVHQQFPVRNLSLGEKSLLCVDVEAAAWTSKWEILVCLFVFFHMVIQRRGGILRCRLHLASFIHRTMVGRGVWTLLFVSTGRFCKVFIDPSPHLPQQVEKVSVIHLFYPVSFCC